MDFENDYLNFDDIVDIFKNHLKIENSVRSISHTFLNERFAKRIDYAPYFQRNYVWDDDKATYFIESILLGTEIPPIVLFDNGKVNEVIDGRQRYETIKRFLENAIELKDSSLKVLTGIYGKRYANLPEEMKDSFINTKIRVLQFSIVNEPSLSPDKEDKVKKEIFSRYNSGIAALKPQEIERAEFIHEQLTHVFKSKLEYDALFHQKCRETLMPRLKQSIKERDRNNYILSRIRTILSLQYVPIQSYAGASSKSDVIRSFYYNIVTDCNPRELYNIFENVISKVAIVRQHILNSDSNLKDNTLLYEALCWAFLIIYRADANVYHMLDNEKIASDIISPQKVEAFWFNISVERRDLEDIFLATGSHYYMSVLNRYTLIADYFSATTGVNFASHLKNKQYFETIMFQEYSTNQFNEFKLSKTDPVSATVYDILADVKNSHFIIRPDYQRSEVPNAIQKASYLMESIMLGIRIPPLFIYRRKDKVSEVIDGQQRLLSILGFLGEPYKAADGKEVFSDKNGFKLTKLKFLKELNGKNIDGVEVIDGKFKDRILDFQIDIVEINEDQNPNFSPIDLFLRLNSKPFPIEPNTFEMWNAYIKKEYATRIKDIAKKYASKLFKPLDTRMKNEELITMLAYLAYKRRKNGESPDSMLNIFVRNQRLNMRFSTKSNITNTLGEISRNNDSVFGEAIEDVTCFINKLEILTGSDFEHFNKMISHARKNTQSKTNQNLYALWIALEHLSLKDVQENFETIFNKIQKMFKEIQQLKEDFDVNGYIIRLAKLQSNRKLSSTPML